MINNEVFLNPINYNKQIDSLLTGNQDVSKKLSTLENLYQGIIGKAGPSEKKQINALTITCIGKICKGQDSVVQERALKALGLDKEKIESLDEHPKKKPLPLNLTVTVKNTKISIPFSLIQNFPFLHTINEQEARQNKAPLEEKLSALFADFNPGTIQTFLELIISTEKKDKALLASMPLDQLEGLLQLAALCNTATLEEKIASAISTKLKKIINVDINSNEFAVFLDKTSKVNTLLAPIYIEKVIEKLLLKMNERNIYNKSSRNPTLKFPLEIKAWLVLHNSVVKGNLLPGVQNVMDGIIENFYNTIIDKLIEPKEKEYLENYKKNARIKFKDLSEFNNHLNKQKRVISTSLKDSKQFKEISEQLSLKSPIFKVNLFQ